MKKIVVTSTTCPHLEFEDIEVVHVPLLTTLCLEIDPPRFETAVFYSKHAVKCAHAAGLDLTLKTVWAVGEATAETIANLFAVAAHTPSEQNFEGLVSELRDADPPLPIASFELAEGPRSLAEHLPDVVAVPTYVTTARTDAALEPLLSRADAVLFASPRAAEAFESIGAKTRIAGAIGPTTAAALRESGFETIIEARHPSLQVLLEQLSQALRSDDDAG